MKNTFGNSIQVTVSGESHGDAVCVIIDGIAPGTPFDSSYIASCLSLRRPSGSVSTARREKDSFSVLSGVLDGKAEGTPICIVIPNSDTRSRDYAETEFLCRPGHADFTANEKYHGYQDRRGGGHFSGRITVGITAAGALCRSALSRLGIETATHIYSIAGISDRPFSDYLKDGEYLSLKSFPVLDAERGEEMKKAIEKASAEGDSVGGITETVITGLPTGVGEPWFDSFESILSHMIFSVPGIKGIEFGAGFSFASMKGSTANDPIRISDGKAVTVTNNNGGINGGITNGMPVIFRCAVKPTPSIAKEQETISTESMENAEIRIKGRHDPCIVHRACHVITAAASIAVLDMLSGRYGTDLEGLRG